MGSLMAGWNSIPKSKSDTYKRNRSLTNDEIEAYWRSNKKPDEKQQHIIKDMSSPDTITSTHEEKTGTVDKSGIKFQKSSSLPVARTRTDQDQEYFMHGETETMASSAHKLINNNGWWTRSNWAFLNEPPTSELGAPNSTGYTSQFHVASATSGSVDGIST
ncbi:hypothetical protein M0R45_012496 [Rubus argutus]|uniref:Uncharacterized protein n=1 Tax=Rubus argutus TaxID=59490 RepID=A0AAW1YD79_RUBAR